MSASRSGVITLLKNGFASDAQFLHLVLNDMLPNNIAAAIFALAPDGNLLQPP